MSLKFLFLLIITSSLFTKSYCQNSDSATLKYINKKSFLLKSSPFILHDIYTENKQWTSLFRIPEHPAFDRLLTPEKEKAILKEINKRGIEIAKDSLLTSDVFYVWKPYFDWLHYNDPHYLIDLMLMTNTKISDLSLLCLKYLKINDTIIVEESADPLFKKGDMILSINNVSVTEYIKFNYNFRYNYLFSFMKNYYFNIISDTFRVELYRDNKSFLIETVGLKNQIMGSDYSIQNYPESNTGYINIGNFKHDNKQLIKNLHTNIKAFKKKGYNNVILDLRKNPGGSGDNFDNLMSIFINKPIIKYQKGAKLKVSDETLQDYDFLTKDMIGQLIDLPEEEVIKEFKTKAKMFIDGINYYVLMSENTGSTAVTFVNMLQYNNAAKLVGVPLYHNALKYGEVIRGGYLYGEDFKPVLLYSTGISTVEYDEYTKALDGVIMPDIHIPYVASDYLSGKDAMLEKLLEILKKEH